MSAELLAQIYADPTDYAARMVYQDWLEERGDPRAHVIEIQTQWSQGKRGFDFEEIDRIILEHWREWIGPASALISPKWVERNVRSMFEDGFLAQADLTIKSAADRELAADPVFSTLEWLTCDQADLVVRPNWKLLRTVTGTLRTFAALAELSYELGVQSVFIDAKDWSRDLDARVIGARAPIFQSLKHVHVDAIPSSDAFDWIVESWIPSRVEDIGVFDYRDEIDVGRFMQLFAANRQMSSILAHMAGSASVNFQRYRQMLRVGLEFVAAQRDQTLAALDGVHGNGWVLELTFPNDAGDLEPLRAAMRTRFGSFNHVDVCHRPDYSDDD